MAKHIKVSTNCEIQHPFASKQTTSQKRSQPKCSKKFLFVVLIAAVICTLFFVVYTYVVAELTQAQLNSKTTHLLNKEFHSINEEIKEINEMHFSPFILLKKLFFVQSKAQFLKRWGEQDVNQKELSLKCDPIFSWVESEVEALCSSKSKPVLTTQIKYHEPKTSIAITET